MKTVFCRRVVVAALALVSWGASAALNSAAVERAPRARVVPMTVETEARVIVKFRSDSALMQAQAASAPPQHARALASRLGLSLADGRVTGPRSQVIKAGGLTSQALAERLAAQSDVEYAVVDGRMHALAVPPNDPLYAGGAAVSPSTGQWYLRAPTSATIASTSSVVSSINAAAAWAITTGSSDVVVAVLDTGVRFDHPDLAAKLLPGYDFISPNTDGTFKVAADGDGRDSDASDPGDYGCGESTSSWHGTQTAGLIGASTNNGIGMASVGRGVTVLPLRVLGCGGGRDSDIQAAMRWAVGIDVAGVPTNTHPAKVLNMSLGATGTCTQAYIDTIAQVNAKGAVVVVSAGNEGLDVGTPANCAGAIAVAGVRHSGTKVGYSDLGAKIAVAAPAGNCVTSSGACLYPILTTSNSGATTPVAATYTSGGDDASLGTSFSSPLVAGTAALMLSANGSLTPAQVLSVLKSSARAFPTTGAGSGVAACKTPTSLTDTSTAQSSECYCTTSTCGAGLLDAGAAVAAVSTAAVSITAPAASVAVGGSLTLDGSASTGSTNRSINAYQWSITSGETAVAITGAANGPTLTLTGTAVGSAVVGLTVTDSAGVQATSSVSVSVTQPVVDSGGGGGGGAMQLGWLLGWLAAVAGVWAVTPRRATAN